MRNWNKLLIGMMILILFSGFFMNTSKDVKGLDDIPNQFSPYNSYDVEYFTTSELPTELNNYRFIILDNIYSNQVASITPEEPVLNSKYGVIQLDIMTEISYTNFGILSEIISYMSNDNVVREVLIFYINDTGINFEPTKWVYVGVEQYTYFQYYPDFLIFDDYDLNPDLFDTFEIDVSYKANNTDLAYKIDVLVNNTLIKSYIDIYGHSDFATFTKSFNSYIGNIYGYTNHHYLSGLRSLYLANENIVSKFIELPSFQDDMSITPYFQDDINLYEQEFWFYIAYQLTEANLERIEFSETIEFQGTGTLQNFTYDFQMIEGLQYNAKFYYTSMVVNPTNMGNWSIVWNWLRDGIAWICNALLIALKFLLYLLVAGISILFGWLFIALIIPFVWNILIFWIIFGAIFLCFYVWIGLLILIDVIIDILLPLLQWIIVEALPVIISGLILIISWIFALLFYLISLGTADILQLQSTIQQFLNVIADFFISSMVFIVKYLPEMLTYILFYFILIGFCYLKITYTKARGFVNRSNQLDASLSAYMMPIQLGYSILQKIKDLIIMWW